MLIFNFLLPSGSSLICLLVPSLFSELHKAVRKPVNSISDDWNDNLLSFNREKMKHQYQSFTRIEHQFQSLKRQVYADWTSVLFPLCQRSCLIWRTMANNDEHIFEYNASTYVVIFLLASIFGQGYHSKYQNFKFTA